MSKHGCVPIKFYLQASLVVQWLRIHLPMQGGMGLIPGMGSFHMPWVTQACAP